MPAKIPKRAWLDRALGEFWTPETKDAGVVHTAVEYMDEDETVIGVFPLVRKFENELKTLNMQDAREISRIKKDFIPVKSFEEGNALSKVISGMVREQRSSEGYTSRWNRARKNR